MKTVGTLENNLRECISEYIGTFALVFFGTGAIVVNTISGGALSYSGVSLVFGLAVMAMVYAVGDISGAHLNPAVTLGFWAARRFPSRSVAPYIISQLAGALSASLALRAIFPGNKGLGATLPSGGAAQSFAMEAILAFFLMFVILNVATGAKEKGIMAGAAIGATIALEALVGGAVSGASMNPARSLGPALVTADLNSIWIYLTAPVLGALVAVFAFNAVKGKEDDI